jgi:hypothetical protein
MKTVKYTTEVKKNNYMKTIKYTTFVLLVTLAFARCNVYDPIYNTYHPEYGKITLTTTWERGEGIAIPAEHTVTTTHSTSEHRHTATLTGATTTLTEPFPEGQHRLRKHNTAEGITVDGATATADYRVEMLGWFFTHASNIVVERDRMHQSTLAMQQQVRQLTLTIKPEGNATTNITAIEASLSGLAEAWNLDTNQPAGDPTMMGLRFVKQENGDWTAVVRLLGVSGEAQQLIAILLLDGDAPPVEIDSDLTTALATFNANKTTPLSLSAAVEIEEEDPTEAGFTATITGWTDVSGGGGVAW